MAGYIYNTSVYILKVYIRSQQTNMRANYQLQPYTLTGFGCEDDIDW